MPPEAALQLDRAVFDVFAAMLNLSCSVDLPGASPRRGETLIVASIALSGTIDGALEVRMERDAATEIAAALLGMPECEVGDEIMADTTGEICNMIAGNWKASFLPRLNDGTEICSIACPVVRTGPAAELPAEMLTRTYRFDGKGMQLALRLD